MCVDAQISNRENPKFRKKALAFLDFGSEKWFTCEKLATELRISRIPQPQVGPESLNLDLKI